MKKEAPSYPMRNGCWREEAEEKRYGYTINHDEVVEKRRILPAAGDYG